MNLLNGVKPKKHGASFPGARQVCYLMEKADTGALTTLELLNIPVDIGRMLYSSFSGSFALTVSGASNNTSYACGSPGSFHRDFAVCVIRSICIWFSDGEVNVLGQ